MFVTDGFFVGVCLLQFFFCCGMFVTVSMLRYLCYSFSAEVCLLRILCDSMCVTDSLWRYVCQRFTVKVCLLQFLC